MFHGKLVRIFVTNMIFIFIFIISNKYTVNITKRFITTESVYMWIM